MICLLAMATGAMAQVGDELVERIVTYYQELPQENIYVHTDKPYYTEGDTIRFRAYLLDAATHRPVSRSKRIYVELHDRTTDTMTECHTVTCDTTGVFADMIVLPKSQHEAQYTMVAYTLWMRNFSPSHFFYKTVTQPSGIAKQTTKQNTDVSDGDSLLSIGLRKGTLLIEAKTDGRAICVVYGNGIVMTLEPNAGKVHQIDISRLGPGRVNVALVEPADNETGFRILAERSLTHGS